jgi:hypothetical protein
MAPPFLTSSLDGDEWSASSLGRFLFPETASGTRQLGACVRPRSAMDAMEERIEFCNAGK